MVHVLIFLTLLMFLSLNVFKKKKIDLNNASIYQVPSEPDVILVEPQDSLQQMVCLFFIIVMI
jgi:uncharacterized membrane protein